MKFLAVLETPMLLELAAKTTVFSVQTNPFSPVCMIISKMQTKEHSQSPFAQEIVISVRLFGVNFV